MSIRNIRIFSLFPILSAVLLFGLGFSPVALAGDLSGLWSLGFEGGINKLTEGYWDYSNADMFGGVTVGRSLTSHWNAQFALRKGQVQPGVTDPQQEAGWTFDSPIPLRTAMWMPSASLQYRFSPYSRFCPTMGVGLGVVSWEVLEVDGEDTPIEGYDTLGQERELSGSDIIISLDLGMDFFVTESIALNIGGRYNLMTGNKVDNIGLSNLWGVDHVDANTAMLQAYVGLTMWFGNTDWDDDGIKNKVDKCPTAAEDFDGFEDEDGCPEIDNDGDRIIDRKDGCPDEAEDMDGFQDLDGCPDPDNDGDGVLDGDDLCPETPAGEKVDDKGCPVEVEVSQSAPLESQPVPTQAKPAAKAKPAPVVATPKVAVAVPATKTKIDDSKVLKGVSFKSGSAQLTPESISVLAKVAGRLKTTPGVKYEIRGYTDSAGDAEENRDLSMRRAISVRDSLIQMGVSASQLNAVGYGEEDPLASNRNSRGRRQNRRVELHEIN